MIAFFALLAAAPSVPGCHSTGASVHCLLAAAIEIPPPKLGPAHHDKPEPLAPHRTQSNLRPKPERKIASSEPPTDPADIQKHVDSLIAIGDCTGAKTAANLLSGDEAADKAYATCVGGVAQPVMSASSAAVESGGAQRKP